MRALRRSRSCRGTLSVLLPSRGDPKSKSLGTFGMERARTCRRLAARSRSVGMTEPICILIGALGGEGGGVLAGWLTDAAEASGYPVLRTSIPGVAQRTGTTSYY